MTGSLASRLTFAALLGLSVNAQGAGQFIEDVRVSRSGDEAVLIIDLACPMRFQSDFPTDGGILLEIRVAPLEDCRQLGLGSGFASERTRPVGGQLAHVLEVEYESLGLGDNLIMLRFDRPVEYRIEQRGGLRSLQVTIRLDPGSAPQLESRREIESADSAIRLETPTAKRTPPARAPMSITVREPNAIADYMINLQSTRDPIDRSTLDTIDVAIDQLLYVSQIEVNGVTWHRLRLGFFSSEREAENSLTLLTERFPRAWIGRAEAREVESAAAESVENDAVFIAEQVEDVVAETGVAPASGSESSVDENVDELLRNARDAVVAEDFGTAIRIYTRVLQNPGPHRAEAIELLGVAREKNGQLAHARAQYEAYLQEFGETPGGARVRQRLNGLLTAATIPKAPLRQSEARDASRWEFGSGISQYFRRHVNQFDEDQQAVVTFSALLTDFDLSLRRQGELLDVSGRIALSHFYDLMDQASTVARDNSRISYAYVDLDAVESDWTVRLGRQSLHNWGVLGRFDGAHFTYGWAEDRRVHYTVGFPVESTRNSVRTDREFQGVAVEFDELIGHWDIGAYLNSQTIEGVDDRQAVGIEARYLDERRSLTGMLDYDVRYGELNTALMLATWRFANQLTLSALVDMRMSPILTTRNALIGQPVTTIEEMLLVWTQEEIEQIALDRTARSTTTTLGIARPLGERFHLNADVTTTEIDSTVASVGVAATPSTGKQIYYSGSLVGSGLFGSGDVTIINLRHGTSPTYDIDQLTWDARFPVGRRIRLNPRLRFTQRAGTLDGRSRDTASVSFRLMVNFRNHYRLEAEFGNDAISRTDGVGEQELTGNFFNLGYRANF